MEWVVVGIVTLPLAGAVANGLLGGRLGARAVSWIGCLVVLGAFGLGVVGFRALTLAPPEAALRAALGEWIVSGDFRVTWELQLDRLAAVMVLVVTGVGFLIHVYSVGYMHGEEAYGRYFTYLNLFVASMLLLVLGGNLLVLFVGWELVGLCSYLLIGFWFERPSAAEAGRKAFVTNRIGDAAFLLGICLLAVTLGTLDFGAMEERLPHAPPAALTVVALLLFAGATGKSAQLPLYVWLPDAMEGPTPVSALIHAATMVTAGVYMVARLWPLYVASGVLPVVAAVGAFTALFAATVAVAQVDLKRILAYSTISQIGYMFLGLGAGSGVAGMFHLTTHAFFKALLFLSAGSVMHAMHGLIDVRRLGGLGRAMPFTAASFLVGSLSLSGIPPLAGFFSKEHVLTAARAHGFTALWTVGVLTAGITALYITRAALLTFGDPPAEPARHPHEAPPVMRWPMGVLLVLSAVGGFLGAGALGTPFDRFLLPVFEREPAPVPAHGPSGELLLGLVSVGAALGGIAVGWIAYRGRRMPDLGALGRALSRQWYVEDLYRAVLVQPARALAHFWARVVDLRWIDGAANGLAAVVGALGAGVRRWQTGYVRQYAALFLVGTVLAVGYWLLR
ncbi:MAG: NADH-quinone oxidoreductase subunit L [Armatimonadota bacterium]|nr:NADH-quinone oxidoreductase subunit L [Armatimonadota bacterium]MDR7443634.1 NADH-quinone oxidoreductase subunit L [Armatimonadota bacterium]MDR7570209.1 NADH-quinone oxidoreductase subunit L [Armatimonadota bacterium]MDR7613836.1 NADH-quinone oxidoreductase subunit L [Armatimonadota bacterium]